MFDLNQMDGDNKAQPKNKVDWAQQFQKFLDEKYP